jgi:two-component system, cell cycle sensor histidine kinase and response regulator CckA
MTCSGRWARVPICDRMAGVAGTENWEQAAVEALDQGVVVFDGTGILHANAASARLLGFAADAMVGRRVGDDTPQVLDEDGVDVGLEESVFLQVLRTRAPVRRIRRVARPDGEPVWLDVAGLPTEFQGRPAAVVVLTDVTAQRRTEEAYRASEQRLQEILDAVDASVFVKDREGRYTFVNDAFLTGVELSRDRVLGRQATDLAGASDDVREQAVAAAEEQDSELFRSGQTVSGVLSGAGGRFYLTTKKPLLDAAGEPYALAGVSTDITAQVHAAEAQATAAAVVESSTDGIVTFDRDLLITGVNATAARDSRAGAQVGQHYLEAFPFGDLQARVEAMLQRVLAGEQVELEYTSDAGPGADDRHVTVRGFPIMSADGAVIGGAVMGRDVTDVRLAEERRQELERQVEHMQRLEGLGQLAGGIAHDFNNLLAAVNLTAEMLRSSVPAGSEQHEQATHIIDIASSATALTARLLVFARKDDPAPRRVDLNAVVRRADDLLARTLGEHVRRRLDLVDRECFVEVDPARLEQVVVNLAVNARDAMPEGGRLHIGTDVVELGEEDQGSFHTRAPGAHVVLTVTDEGTGMPPDVRARAFDPFFTTKARGHGTGLGLAMVFGVAAQAGGGTWLYSEPGQGTVVKVALPLVGAPAPAREPAPAAPPRHGAGARIAVVEDEEALRRVACRLLTRAGYVVDPFEDGLSFLSAVSAMHSPPDLLVSDVVLPGMSGPEAAAKARETFPALRVLFVSGYTAGLLAQHQVEGEVLAKPFTSATLLDAVQRAMAATGDA